MDKKYHQNLTLPDVFITLLLALFLTTWVTTAPQASPLVSRSQPMELDPVVTIPGIEIPLDNTLTRNISWILSSGPRNHDGQLITGRDGNTYFTANVIGKYMLTLPNFESNPTSEWALSIEVVKEDDFDVCAPGAFISDQRLQKGCVDDTKLTGATILPITDQFSFHDMFLPESSTGQWFHACKQQNVCEWPLKYEFMPAKLYLTWKTQLPLSVLHDIVNEKGFSLSLRINELSQTKGPSVAQGNTADHDFWAFAGDCGNNTCITIGLLTDGPLETGAFNTSKQPWIIQLNVKQVDSSMPPVVFLDENGHTHTYSIPAFVPFREGLLHITANKDASSYFEDVLFPTFQHPRCADCHSLGTLKALYKHHRPYADTTDKDLEFYADDLDVHLEPSLYDPTGDVITCTNCHADVLPQYDPSGNSWHESEWKEPHANLGLDWLTLTAVQACAKVVSNLPTHTQRHLHFHGDVRLMWATELSINDFTKLPTAPPHSFTAFLGQVDRWNDGGAPCPK